MIFRSAALALAVFFAASADAFAPPSASSSFQNYNVATTCTPSTQQLSCPTPPPSASSPRSADMSMNMHQPRNIVDLHNMFVYAARPDLALTDQLIRIAKANMKNVVDSIDSKSPESQINRALQDMQNDLIKIKQAHAESVELQRHIVMQKRQVEAVAGEWYRRAAYALKRGYEISAKDALAQRQNYIEAAKNLQIQLDAQSAATERLYEGMELIEEKFRENLGKRTELISRAKTAQSVKKVNEVLSGMTGNTSFDAFDRLEKKVATMEAEAEGSTEQVLRASAPHGDKLEMEFESLENSASIEDEYKKLKEDLRKSTAGRSKTDTEIQRELERLGKKLIESGYL